MGIGDFFTSILGSKNKYRATAPTVDSNAYQYGGASGGAQRAAQGYAEQANNAAGRQGVQVDYGQANQDRALGMQARAGQGAVAQSALARALGQTPSIAQQQADRQMGQAQAAQASMAASARGAGALANAQRNAANNVANAQSDISGQAQINAGNERLAAENSAANQFGAMRGGDAASQGMSAQQAQAQAGFNDAQSARNDAMQMGYDQLANNVNTTQLGAQMNQQAQQSANSMGAQGINAGVAGQNATMNQANGMAGVGLLQNGAGAVMNAATKATGGHTAGGKPYLVGENGPELVVPQKDAYVVPHDQTLQTLRGQPASVVAGLFRRGQQAAPGHSLSSVLGDARCMGGYMGARADGGPVEGAIASGQMVPPPAADEASLMPPGGFVPAQSTWGAKPADVDQQQRDYLADQRARLQPADDAAKALADHRAGLDATAKRVNETVKGIDDRDRETVWNADYKDRHGQKMTPEEEDAAVEARYRQNADKKQQRQRSKLASVLGDTGTAMQQQAGNVDTAYHGPAGGYTPPQLIPIVGTRAMGGPMGPGGAVDMGGKGYMSSADILRGASGLAGQTMPGMVGGGGVVGGGVNLGADGIRGAREDGGPVEGAKPASETRRLGPIEYSAPTQAERHQQALSFRDAADDGVAFTPALATLAPGLGYLGVGHGVLGNAAALAMDPSVFKSAPSGPVKPAVVDEMARSGSRQTQLASVLGSLVPGAGAMLGANALGTAAAAGTLRAEDKAATDASRAAQDEQKAQDDERAAMNAAERAGGPAAPAHGVASTPLAPEDERKKSRMGFLLSYLLGSERGR